MAYDYSLIVDSCETNMLRKAVMAGDVAKAGGLSAWFFLNGLRENLMADGEQNTSYDFTVPSGRVYFLRSIGARNTTGDSAQMWSWAAYAVKDNKVSMIGSNHAWLGANNTDDHGDSISVPPDFLIWGPHVIRVKGVDQQE